MLDTLLTIVVSGLIFYLVGVVEKGRVAKALFARLGRRAEGK